MPYARISASERIGTAYRIMKPLFIPLKTEYYESFERGEKTEELRLYGPRWNEKTCTVGREVVLSKGYGKQNRLKGYICKFRKQHGSTFSKTYRDSILDVFSGFDVYIACISITGITPAPLSLRGLK